MSSRATGRRTMARRAGRALAPRTGRALAASLVLTAIGMPAALLASQAPAAAAAGTRLAQNHISVAITGMTPRQAGPGATITVTGTVTNSSRQPISHLSVQLRASSTPVSTPAELRPGSNALDVVASRPVPHGTWKASSELQPGTTDHWHVQVKANSIGMTRFGVYPLTAQAQTTPALLPLAATATYLPYVPAKKGPYGSTIPARTKIAWVLPLIDKPLLGPPWQRSCQGPQAQALVTSLSSGRLAQLLKAGGVSSGTAAAYSAASGSGRAAQSRAVRSQEAQSLSSYDGVTWAVDPALLANVKALVGCGSSQPNWASAASSWLTELRQVTAAEPTFFTPYADPDVAALISHRRATDVANAFTLGRSIGRQILAGGRSSSAQSQAAGIAWPADGISTYPTAEFLAAPQAGTQTLLLGSGALRREPSTVVRVNNGSGGDMNVLLANASLTNLLSARRNSTGGAFATEQDFLAQTALAAQQGGAPVIVAPPHRWDPAPGLTTELLTETASAPWLSPVSLTSLTAGTHIPHVRHYAFTNSPAPIGKKELRRLARVDHGITQLDYMAANPDKKLPLALATIESSAWRSRSGRTARRMLAATVLSKIHQQERGVQILASPRVTLGGLKGSVPVSIDNRLGYPVKVQLQVESQAPGVKITAVPPGVVTVPAHNALTVHLHVQATQVGSAKVTMSLLDKDGRPLRLVPATTRPYSGFSASMTVEATQVGVLGVIIFAAALGIFLIAYAARAARRGHPPGAADGPADPGPAADQSGDHSTEPAEPDTVMAERTELGTAGAPGP